jgi:uncharacterized protein
MMASPRSVPLTLLIFLTAILVSGAALAPALFYFGREILPHWLPLGTEGSFFADIRQSVMDSPFSRYFNRSVTIAALLLLWPAARVLGVKRGIGKEMGLGRGEWPVTASVVGFFLAATFLLALGWWLVANGWYRAKNPVPWGNWQGPIIAGVGVGLIEEWFFRGVILGLALRGGRPMLALFATTMLFAFVHFLQPTDAMQIPDGAVTWSSGFVLLGRMLGSFGDFNIVVAEFATLFLVGWILGWFRLKTGAIWGAVGLHAGWVFGLKWFSGLTRATHKTAKGENLPWMGDSLKSGLLPLFVLALTWLVLALLWRWWSRRKSEG